MHVESTIHPHVPAERAELFLSDDGNSPELDYRNLIAALISATKPSHILETGTGEGRTTLAMLQAALPNPDFHELTTIEKDPALSTKARLLLAIWARALAYTDFVKGADSLEVLSTARIKATFDFCFLDSALSIRAQELRLLCQRKLLTPGALIAVHDTSTHREMPAGTRCAESIQYHAELEEVLASFPQLVGPIVFPLSRGLHLFQWKG